MNQLSTFLLVSFFSSSFAVAAAPSSCTSLDDCNGAGLCISGTCHCDAGFTGPNCSRLALGLSYNCHDGGLCLFGNNTNPLGAHNTWGGSASYNEKDGKWHMFSAVMKNYGTLSEWLRGSNIGHAVSDTPEGPYLPSDLTLKDIPNSTAWDSSTQHNPAITRAPDGTWLLFYMGTYGTHDGSMNECGKKKTAAICNQQIGLATASSPYGPWNRSKTPLLAPRTGSAWDNVFVNNPAAVVHPNGTTVLIYKGRNASNPSGMFTGTAIAPSYLGPYERMPAPITTPSHCEDATIFFSNYTQTYHGLFHCGCNYKLIWSTDGRSWKNSGEEDFCRNVSFSDGTHANLDARQRPSIIHDQNGKVTHLATSARFVKSPGLYNNKPSFTMTAQLL